MEAGPLDGAEAVGTETPAQRVQERLEGDPSTHRKQQKGGGRGRRSWAQGDEAWIGRSSSPVATSPGPMRAGTDLAGGVASQCGGLSPPRDRARRSPCPPRPADPGPRQERLASLLCHLALLTRLLREEINPWGLCFL